MASPDLWGGLTAGSSPSLEGDPVSQGPGLRGLGSGHFQGLGGPGLGVTFTQEPGWEVPRRQLLHPSSSHALSCVATPSMPTGAPAWALGALGIQMPHRIRKGPMVPTYLVFLAESLARLDPPQCCV